MSDYSVDIKESIQRKFMNSADLVFQKLESNTSFCEFCYLSSICDKQKIHQDIFTPFFEEEDIKEYRSYIKSLAGIKVLKEKDDPTELLIRGSMLLFFQSEILTLEVKQFVNKTIPDTTIETTIQGPQTGLSEDLETNINILRNRYHQVTLAFEDAIIGEKSQTGIKIIYDSNEVDQSVLKEVKKKLDSSKVDVIQSAGQLSRLMSARKTTLFPTIVITERPDRIAYNLSKGKIIIMLEGTRFALVIPSVFFDFMSSMDDIYQPYWITKFLLVLRYFGLGVAILLPAIYVGMTAYNPELFRVQLALSIAGSRAGVPFPAYIEVLFMLIMMELLTEASLRLPKAIGPTATTVGGLILGQAATEAGLVSNIMIIIVSAVAISNFVIPINEMSFAMRVIKYLLLFLATILGLVGVLIGLLAIIYYLVNLNSFGKPYLQIFLREEMKESKIGS
ncbi:spore germination protein [Metabacillus crassostreae]|uniref:spore germination protein n=1 Tax=Metabacillus crassostreae TaxID=929098 RepID=UPI001956A109|nr:spore germination protein [Metabacillus crassostreae]MBM7606393.1 spore germination protein [Metabacillus crassostreae]